MLNRALLPMLFLALLAPSLASAQALADYIGAPPFLSTGVPEHTSAHECELQQAAAKDSSPPLPLGNLDAALRQLEPHEATNRYKQRLLNTINSMNAHSASGTSPALLRSGSGEGALFHAFFYPVLKEGETQTSWAGFLQGLFVDRFNNLREDSDGDGRLVLQRDSILRPRFDPLSGEMLVERYHDMDGDGRPDTFAPFDSGSVREILPIWEAGTQLAMTDPDTRRLLTWVDLDDDGLVTSSEVLAFSEQHQTTLAPFLRAGPEPYTATNLIRFIRGQAVPKLRDRDVALPSSAGGQTAVWRLGDPMHSSPVVVGAPKERYDVLYGDAGYAEFFRRYRHRRQMVYMGANDGMLHAFNAGFYHAGDDAKTEQVEQGWFTQSPTGGEGGGPLGAERWGFIPFQLLPHLQWLARHDYGHVYYVDLKPKVTDVRIFTPDEEHPGGWGTILIGGFRMGGSCAACQASTGAAPMRVRADFGAGVESRTFYTAYFALDITNPERDPVLLWSFSDEGLGLATAYPTVVRVAPETRQGGPPRTVQARTARDEVGERWFMVVGSGPTGYDGSSRQSGRMFAVDLKQGPVDPAGLQNIVRFETEEPNSFFGDATAVDIDLDFRVDAVYVGSSVRGTPKASWTGKLYRLTLGGHSDPRLWGIANGADRMPTVLLGTLPPRLTPQVDLLMTPADSAQIPVTYGFVGDELQELTFEILEDPLGPITTAPSVGLDEHGELWVFAGTGRFFGTLDKTNSDPQYLIAVKDPVVHGVCLEYSTTACERRQLEDLSQAGLCWQCRREAPALAAAHALGDRGPGQGRETDGWFLPLPAPRERILASPSLVGGVLFVPTFIPNSTLCASSGYAYLLYYTTGEPYDQPVVTTHRERPDPRAAAVPLGPSGMVTGITINPTRRPPSPQQFAQAECRDWSLGFVQSSLGPPGQVCAQPALPLGSRLRSWMSHRHG